MLCLRSALIQILAYFIDEAYFSNSSCNPIEDANPNELVSVEKQAMNDLSGKNTDLSVELKVAHDDKGCCSNSQIQSIMDSHIQRCDYYNISHSECVKWIEEEIERSCCSKYSCIETSTGSGYAAYRNFGASTSK